MTIKKIKTPRSPRESRRGLTLIEVVIGTLIAIFLTAAAVVFASHETKLLGFSTEQVEMQQSARTALDLLARDIELAGSGIGYQNCDPAFCNPPTTGPRFVGLQTGQFNAINGGLAFNTNAPNGTDLTLRGSTRGNALAAVAYTFRTHDLGILMAEEQRMSIANHAGGFGEICDSNNLLPTNQNILVVLRDDSMISGRSAVMQVTSAAVLGNCSFDPCGPNIAGGGQGCRTVTFANDPWAIYASDNQAAGLSYGGGEVAVGLKQVIWWVQNDSIAQDSHRGNLRRAELGINTQSGVQTLCDATPGNRSTCGGEVAYNVETLQYQVWRYDPTAAPAGNATIDAQGGVGRWIAVAPGPIDPQLATPTTKDKLRVDVEIVVRARMPDERIHGGQRVTIPGLCIPGGTAMPASAATSCPNPDNVQRRVHRISVELKSSGRAA